MKDFWIGILITACVVSCLPVGRVELPESEPPPKESPKPTPTPTATPDARDEEIRRLRDEADLYRTQRDEYASHNCDCSCYEYE